MKPILLTFCILHSAFCIVIASPADAQTASATAPKIAVNTFDGEQRAVSPKDIEYSPLWCGAADGDGSAYVVIEKVEHAGMHNAATSTVTTCSAGAAGAYAYTVGVGDEPCVRLIHRVCNGNGTVIGETLVRDVAFGVASQPSEGIFADSRDNLLQREAVLGKVVGLAYDTAWATNAASIAIYAVKIQNGRGADLAAPETNVLFSANAEALGVFGKTLRSGGWRFLLTSFDGNGAVICAPYFADYLLKSKGTTISIR
jgi:hypothetical protein